MGTDVAVFVPGLAAGGGAERTALVAARALAGAGRTVICFTDGEVHRSRLEAHFGMDLGHVELRALPTPAIAERLPRAVRDLLLDLSHARAIRAEAPDLFINMKFKSELPPLGRVSWYYTHFPHHIGVGARSRLHRAYLDAMSLARRVLLQRGAARFIDRYDRVLANSDFTATHVRARWGLAAATLYPPCGDGSTPRRIDREKIVINVGRFQARRANSPHKRQDVLVDAWARAPELAHDGWTLHLVGAAGTSAEDCAFLEHVRSLASGLSVTIHEDAPHEELTDLLSRARIYWHAQGFGSDPDRHPETQEHFGISTVEAMAAGVVPVVYGTAGPAEVVEGRPALTWLTTEDLVDRTRDLLVAGTWEREHAYCTRRAARFSESAFVNALVDLYDSDTTGRLDPRSPQ